MTKRHRWNGARVLRSLALAATLVAASGFSQVGATELTGIGSLDQTQLNATPLFRNAQDQLATFKQQLDAQFEAQMRTTPSGDQQQRLASTFAQRFADKQHALLDPLIARAQTAIASVASSRSLSVVVDRRIIIVGATDITGDVVTLFSGPSAPVPPSSTPGSSPVGYVDQRTVDAVPSVKAANDQYLAFEKQTQAQTRAALAKAKDQAAKDALVAQAQRADEAQQHSLIDPVVERTRKAMSDIAARRKLVLIIDKAALIYGGTDVTSDVQSALK